MASILLDLENQAVVTASVFGSTTGIAATGAGASVDLIDTIGNYATAVQVVGTVTGTSPTLDTKVQESTDGTTWTDAVDQQGNTLAFTQVTTSTNVQAASWMPRKRYCRTTSTTGGTTPVFPTATLFIAQRRATPANKGGFDQTAAAS